MMVEQNLSLQPYNSFGIAAKAQRLVRVTSETDVQAVLADWTETRGEYLAWDGEVLSRHPLN